MNQNPQVPVQEKKKEREKVHITLFANDEHVPRSLQESFGMALLNSGCTKTVARKL